MWLRLLQSSTEVTSQVVPRPPDAAPGRDRLCHKRNVKMVREIPENGLREKKKYIHTYKKFTKNVKCNANDNLELRHFVCNCRSVICSIQKYKWRRTSSWRYFKETSTEMWLTKTFPSSSESPHSKRAFSEFPVQFLLFRPRSNHCPQTRWWQLRSVQAPQPTSKPSWFSP